MVKVPIWAYYRMNSCVQPEQDPPVYYSIVILTILYYLRVVDLMGITSPYPRENIIAGNYILADMQAYLDKRHRQQNKEMLIRHSLGIGGCFFVFKYSINRKNKKLSGAVKMLLSVSYYVRVFLTEKNKKFFIKRLYLCPSSFV